MPLTGEGRQGRSPTSAADGHGTQPGGEGGAGPHPALPPAHSGDMKLREGGSGRPSALDKLPTWSLCPRLAGAGRGLAGAPHRPSLLPLPVLQLHEGSLSSRGALSPAETGEGSAALGWAAFSGCQPCGHPAVPLLEGIPTRRPLCPRDPSSSSPTEEAREGQAKRRPSLCSPRTSPSKERPKNLRGPTASGEILTRSWRRWGRLIGQPRLSQRPQKLRTGKLPKRPRDLLPLPTAILLPPQPPRRRTWSGLGRAAGREM